MASSVNRVRISDAIQKTLDTIPMAAKRRSVGVVHKDEYWWSYNLDTLNESTDRQYTLVYFFKTGGWSLYNYGFSDVTSFNPSTDVINLSPPTDQWFIRGYGNQIYTPEETLIYQLDKNTIVPGFFPPSKTDCYGSGLRRKVKGIWRSGYVYGNGENIIPNSVGYLRYLNGFVYNEVRDTFYIYRNKDLFVEKSLYVGTNSNQYYNYWKFALPKTYTTKMSGFYWGIVSEPHEGIPTEIEASTIYSVDLWIDKYGYNIDH